jgi:hypothetical protein
VDDVLKDEDRKGERKVAMPDMAGRVSERWVRAQEV